MNTSNRTILHLLFNYAEQMLNINKSHKTIVYDKINIRLKIKNLIHKADAIDNCRVLIGQLSKEAVKHKEENTVLKKLVERLNIKIKYTCSSMFHLLSTSIRKYQRNI